MKPNNLTSNRILYFDYLEVLAIFLVVSIHRSWFDLSYSASILSIICSICVPLFSWLMVHYYFTDLSI